METGPASIQPPIPPATPTPLPRLVLRLPRVHLKTSVNEPAPASSPAPLPTPASSPVPSSPPPAGHGASDPTLAAPQSPAATTLLPTDDTPIVIDDDEGGGSGGRGGVGSAPCPDITLQLHPQSAAVVLPTAAELFAGALVDWTAGDDDELPAKDGPPQR